MALRYIGSATTNANGVATLSDGYTGTGAGKVDLVASVDVDGSSVVSTPYEVTDCTFLDIATTGKKNSNWTNAGNRLQITTGDDGTLLAKNGSGWNIYYCNGTDSTYPFSKTACIECDIVSCTNEVRLQVYGGTGTQRFQITLPTNATNYHVKIEIGETNLIATVNGVTETYTRSTYVSDNFQVDFATNVDGASVKYKNFCIYPI